MRCMVIREEYAWTAWFSIISLFPQKPNSKGYRRFRWMCTAVMFVFRYSFGKHNSLLKYEQFISDMSWSKDIRQHTNVLLILIFNTFLNINREASWGTLRNSRETSSQWVIEIRKQIWGNIECQTEWIIADIVQIVPSVRNNQSRLQYKTK